MNASPDLLAGPAWQRLFAALCLLLAGGISARAEIAGTWNVVERDPFLADNEFFGQFRYQMVIEREGDGYVIHVPRTGARFGPVPLREGRLVAEGLDPNRGRARVEIGFPAADRLAGTIQVASSRRELSGEPDPEAQLAQVGDSIEAARRQAAAAVSRAEQAEAYAGATAARLAAAEAERDRLGREVAALRIELEKLRAERRTAAAASRPAPPPVPASAPVPPAGARMSLRVIEPPVDAATGNATVRGDKPVVVGHVEAPAGVMILRVNGNDVVADAQGLFQTTLPPGTPDVEVVAVDRNGTRRAVAFMLQLAPASLPAAAAPVPVGDSARSRCYALAIAPPEPDPRALEVCRAAVQQAPDEAIDHYNLGVALSRLGRHAEAIMAYREAAGRWAR